MWPGKSSRKSNRLGLLDHLEELRARLLLVLATVGILSIAAYFFSKPLLDFLTLPLRAFPGESELYFQAPYEAFLTHLKVSLLTGALVASPLFFLELWFFMAPGLYREERRTFLPLVLASIFLFLVGAAFAFWVVVPFGLRFFLSFETDSLRPLLGIGPYFSFLVGMILACGAAFDLPVVVLGLVRARILNAVALRIARKGVIVFVFILTAVLTPSSDPVGQILLAFPILLLYEGCVWVAKGMEKKNGENSLRRG